MYQNFLLDKHEIQSDTILWSDSLFFLQTSTISDESVDTTPEPQIIYPLILLDINSIKYLFSDIYILRIWEVFRIIDDNFIKDDILLLLLCLIRGIFHKGSILYFNIVLYYSILLNKYKLNEIVIASNSNGFEYLLKNNLTCNTAIMSGIGTQGIAEILFNDSRIIRHDLTGFEFTKAVEYFKYILNFIFV